MEPALHGLTVAQGAEGVHALREEHGFRLGGNPGMEALLNGLLPEVGEVGRDGYPVHNLDALLTELADDGAVVFGVVLVAARVDVAVALGLEGGG